MFLHCYSKGQDIENVSISQPEAFSLIENQETIETDEDTFIGFTLEQSEFAVLQFIRLTESDWLIDIPRYSNSTYVGTLNAEISHSLVFLIVNEFFNTTILQNAFIKNNYEEIQSISKNRWKLIFSQVD